MKKTAYLLSALLLVLFATVFLARRIGEPVALNGANLVPSPTGAFLEGGLVNVDEVVLLVDLSVAALRIGRASRL